MFVAAGLTYHWGIKIMRNNYLTFLTGSFKQVIICIVLMASASCGDNADGQNSTKEGSVCGGLSGKTCPENQFCKYNEGSCGQADQTGVCTEKAEFCAEIFTPVCGCDQKTYSNECYANIAGTSLKSQGECK